MSSQERSCWAMARVAFPVCRPCCAREPARACARWQRQANPSLRMRDEQGRRHVGQRHVGQCWLAAVPAALSSRRVCQVSFRVDAVLRSVGVGLASQLAKPCDRRRLSTGAKRAAMRGPSRYLRPRNAVVAVGPETSQQRGAFGSKTKGSSLPNVSRMPEAKALAVRAFCRWQAS